MNIVMTGGGSGGHITPILAVASEIKHTHPEYTITYIGQTGDAFGAVVAEHALIDRVFTVQAGKFRRYHSEGLRQLLDVRTAWLNIRDAFRVVVGFVQCWQFLRHNRPDVVFCKGGFVGVPVGLAAALLGIPYVTHDSDAIPGLANRIIARWAAKHAVALDPKLYPYSATQTINTGVPVAPEYQRVTPDLQADARKVLGIDPRARMIVITGGGLGAARLNHATVKAMPALLDAYPDAVIVHTAGAKHESVVGEAYDAMLSPAQRQRVTVLGYTTKLALYSAAADVVVARGGATNLAELAVQGKACIVVPNPLLTGGHQLKNAKAFADKDAILVVDETALKHNHELLLHAIMHLLDDTELRQRMSKALLTFARPNAAKELAECIISVASSEEKRVS